MSADAADTHGFFTTLGELRSDKNPITSLAPKSISKIKCRSPYKAPDPRLSAASAQIRVPYLLSV
jgi:hypothetical protein